MVREGEAERPVRRKVSSRVLHLFYLRQAAVRTPPCCVRRAPASGVVQLHREHVA